MVGIEGDHVQVSWDSSDISSQEAYEKKESDVVGTS
jgi:hypothetical protein